MHTFRGVANGRPEVLEPAQLHVQRVVQQLERHQLVPLEEAHVDRRRAAHGEVDAPRDVRAVRKRSREEREPKRLG